MFDIFDFGFGTESILPIENYHNMIDAYYPGVPRKTTVKVIIWQIEKIDIYPRKIKYYSF